jgi:hypothetical protein
MTAVAHVKAADPRCAQFGRSDERRRFSKAVVRGRRGKWLGRVETEPSVLLLWWLISRLEIAAVLS